MTETRELDLALVLSDLDTARLLLTVLVELALALDVEAELLLDALAVVLLRTSFLELAAWAPDNKKAVAQTATARSRQPGSNRWEETRPGRVSDIEGTPAETKSVRSVAA